MSIHAQLTPEAAAKLNAQNRNTTISSVVISALILILLGMGLYFIFLQPILIEVPTMITYQGNAEEEVDVTKKKVTTQVSKKPAAPSSSMARVIASTSPSNISIPVPDTNVSEPSIDFGDGDDFGEGWGDDGESFGGGEATFFGQKVTAKRVCYVIDYSASMNSGGRHKLMRAEMKNSLNTLVEGMQYQLILFAGPAWVAGDQVNMVKGNKGAAVMMGDKSFDWICGGKPGDWDTKGTKQVPKWLEVSVSQLEASQKIVKNEKLVWGTDWEHPLEMAMSMEPKPEVIYFMTDGATSDSERVAKDIGRQAKKHNIIINCVALMEPKAKEGMMDLAKRAKGQFTMVGKGGKVVEIPIK